MLALLAALSVVEGGYVLSSPPASAGAPPPSPRSLSEATVEAFSYPSLDHVEARVAALAAAHPTLVRTWTAQQAYGTQAGQCHTHTQATVVCHHTFVKLTNFTSGAEAGWAAQSPALLDRPQMFFSGNLHGNEWVGPVVLLNLVEMLLACAADPAAPCFSPWLARLLNTRTLVFLIVSNPEGYSAVGKPQREDHGLDPNRDFAYATNSCMKTSTAQAINSAWREHIFQLSLTFHGGMESITYEWGAPGQDGPAVVSPDDVSQADLCNVLRDVAGVFNSHTYIVGRTNDVVYAVEGGMEDWAYAGSWGPGKGTCTGHEEETTYHSATLRAFNVLVEADEDKVPAAGLLGGLHSDAGWLGVLDAAAPSGQGHVPRNMRLCLAAIDMLAPYIEVLAIAGAAAPSSGSSGNSSAAAALANYSGPFPCSSPGACALAPAPNSPTAAMYDHLSAATTASSGGVQVTYDVGGGMHAEQSGLLLALWDARVPPEDFWRQQPSASGPSSEASAAATPFTPSPAFLAHAGTAYGMSPPAAAAFARTLFWLQRFADGVSALADLPQGVALGATPPVPATSLRWSAATLPDMGKEPYSPRFAACIQVAALPSSGSEATATTTTLSVTSYPHACGEAPTAPPSVLHVTGPAAPPNATLFVPLLAIPYAIVDAGAWGATLASASPGDTPPQSHWVNARSNPAWRQEVRQLPERKDTLEGWQEGGVRVWGRHQATALALHLGLGVRVEAAGGAGGSKGGSISGSSKTHSSTPTPSHTPTPSGSAGKAAKSASPTPTHQAAGAVAQPAANASSATPTPTPTPSPSASVAAGSGWQTADDDAAAEGPTASSTPAAAAAPAGSHSHSHSHVPSPAAPPHHSASSASSSASGSWVYSLLSPSPSTLLLWALLLGGLGLLVSWWRRNGMEGVMRVWEAALAAVARVRAGGLAALVPSQAAGGGGGGAAAAAPTGPEDSVLVAVGGGGQGGGKQQHKQQQRRMGSLEEVEEGEEEEEEEGESASLVRKPAAAAGAAAGAGASAGGRAAWGKASGAAAAGAAPARAAKPQPKGKGSSSRFEEEEEEDEFEEEEELEREGAGGSRQAGAAAAAASFNSAAYKASKASGSGSSGSGGGKGGDDDGWAAWGDELELSDEDSSGDITSASKARSGALSAQPATPPLPSAPLQQQQETLPGTVSKAKPKPLVLGKKK